MRTQAALSGGLLSSGRLLCHRHSLRDRPGPSLTTLTVTKLLHREDLHSASLKHLPSGRSIWNPDENMASCRELVFVFCDKTRSFPIKWKETIGTLATLEYLYQASVVDDTYYGRYQPLLRAKY